MNIKVKKDPNSLFYSFNHCKDFTFDNYTYNAYVVLNDKWIFKDIHQDRNKLIIETIKGDIHFVFTGEIYNIKFVLEEKDYLYFYLTKQ